jgi:hypothetical protein
VLISCIDGRCATFVNKQPHSLHNKAINRDTDQSSTLSLVLTLAASDISAAFTVHSNHHQPYYSIDDGVNRK